MTIFGLVLCTILFIAFIVLIGYFVQELSLDEFKWWGHVLASPLYAMGSMLIMLTLLFMVMAITHSSEQPDLTSSTKTEIYSIGVNTRGEVHGHFVLGCGSVNGETYPTYRFYTMSDNRYHLNEVNANNFDIVCTDTIEPCIVYNATRTMTYPVRMKWFWKDTVYTTIEEKNMSGIIYIPTNSIVQSYKIQL
jgi:hypothetical protein